jgi:hypothetical protein
VVPVANQRSLDAISHQQPVVVNPPSSGAHSGQIRQWRSLEVQALDRISNQNSLAFGMPRDLRQGRIGWHHRSWLACCVIGRNDVSGARGMSGIARFIKKQSRGRKPSADAANQSAKFLAQHHQQRRFVCLWVALRGSFSARRAPARTRERFSDRQHHFRAAKHSVGVITPGQLCRPATLRHG